MRNGLLRALTHRITGEALAQLLLRCCSQHNAAATDQMSKVQRDRPVDDRTDPLGLESHNIKKVANILTRSTRARPHPHTSTRRRPVTATRSVPNIRTLWRKKTMELVSRPSAGQVLWPRLSPSTRLRRRYSEPCSLAASRQGNKSEKEKGAVLALAAQLAKTFSIFFFGCFVAHCELGTVIRGSF
jgi:hypothetical protein